MITPVKNIKYTIRKNKHGVSVAKRQPKVRHLRIGLSSVDLHLKSKQI